MGEEREIIVIFSLKLSLDIIVVTLANSFPVVWTFLPSDNSCECLPIPTVIIFSL